MATEDLAQQMLREYLLAGALFAWPRTGTCPVCGLTVPITSRGILVQHTPRSTPRRGAGLGLTARVWHGKKLIERSGGGGSRLVCAGTYEKAEPVLYGWAEGEGRA